MRRLPDSKRHIDTFSLSDAEDRKAYDALISDPLVTILEKKTIKLRKEDWEGEDGTVDEHFEVILEWEQKSL